MKKNTILLLPAVLLALASCDKIDSDQYVNHTSGGGGSAWLDPAQHAFVEKYTGPSCTFCPLADQTLDAAHEQYGDRLVVISINDCFTGQGAPHAGNPDLRNEAGRQWEEYAIGTASGIPAALLGRDRSKKYSSAMSDIVPAIGEVLSQSASVSIALAATRVTADSLSITVDLRMLADIAAPMTLTLALTEDSLRYQQTYTGQGVVDDYCHNHMLRDVATPVWGVDIDASGHNGEQRTATFGYRIPASLSPAPVLENCHIVALVSDKATRRVLNANQCTIEP